MIHSQFHKTERSQRSSHKNEESPYKRQIPCETVLFVDGSVDRVIPNILAFVRNALLTKDLHFQYDEPPHHTSSSWHLWLSGSSVIFWHIYMQQNQIMQPSHPHPQLKVYWFSIASQRYKDFFSFKFFLIFAIRSVLMSPVSM